MHRLWRLCPSLPGIRDFCAGRPPREMEAIYGTQRELREGRQVHVRRVRQAPSQVVLGLLRRFTRLSNRLEVCGAVSRSAVIPSFSELTGHFELVHIAKREEELSRYV